MQSKGVGARHEIKQASVSSDGSSQAISSQVLHEAITRSLDEFCEKVLDLKNGTEKYLYQQILFTLEN